MRSSSIAAPLTAVPQALPPLLYQALANLDVQIEEELARYRRQRHQRTGTPRAIAPVVPVKTSPKTLDLISIPALGGRTQPWSGSNPHPEGGLTDAVPYAAADLTRGNDSTNSTMDPAIPGAGSDLVVVDATMVDRDRLGDALSVTATTLPDAPNEHLEDYLESSEALLQSLAVEEAQVRAETGFMKSLVTPVGVGSMLLLLLSSSLFGYMLMNPGSLSQILAMGSPPSAVPAGSPVAAAGGAALSPLEPNLAAQEFKDLNINTLGTLKLNGSALKSPNLPSPLLTPGSKPAGANATVGADGKPISGVSGKPGTATRVGLSLVKPTVGPAGGVRPQFGPVYTPQLPRIPVYQPPQPAPRSPAPRPAAPARSTGRSEDAIARPQPAASTSPIASPSASPAASPTATSAPTRRTVVVPFTNDRDLDAAQRVDPSAHMDSNFNDGITRINAGSYADEAAAKARVEQFQKQGVNAQIREEP
jgi:hypothetical protein